MLYKLLRSGRPKPRTSFCFPCVCLFFSAAVLLPSTCLRAQTLRIVNYNIDADITSGSTGSLPNATALEGVLEGIGSSHLNDDGTPNAQPIDVLALEEVSSTSNSTSNNGVATPSVSMLQTIVGNLNAHYGAGVYTYDDTPDPTTGGTGGGPSALIYNTHTVSISGVTSIGTPSGSNEARAPMQYLLQPVGYPSAAQFYLDVSHMKSGTVGDDSTNPTRRNDEATNIINNLATLGGHPHLISAGDFNITGASSEQTYKTLTSTLTDVGNPANNWTDTSTFTGLLSESATALDYRDDMQLLSAAATSNSGFSGVQYVNGSYTVFGNGGTTALYENNVTSQTAGPGGSVFTDMTQSQGAALLTDLSEATDHLPIVADYSIVGVPAPEPCSIAFLAAIGVFVARPRRRSTLRHANLR